MKRSPATVSLLLFGSGLTALVYQTTWLRELRLIFGASTASSAAVLAIFMGGLGIGGLVIGRRVDRSPNSLLLYGNLELIISVGVALSPLLLELARVAYISTGGTFALGQGAGTGVKLLLATIVLGLPAFLMGGTLPAAARSIETRQDVNRRLMALIYGANTLGAVTGAVLTTFLLLEIYGNRKTLWIACLLNLLIGLAARAIARNDPPDADEPVEPVEEERLLEREAPTWFVLAASGISGFVFFLLEIIWYRMLAPLLGGSVFSFGLILAVALLGIGLGSFVYSLTLSGRRVTLFHFAMTAAVEAILIALPLAMGDSIALGTLMAQDLTLLGFGGSVLIWTAVTTVVVLPTAIVAGFQFPLLVALLGSGREGIGTDIGRAYLANTIGAILGSLAGGFGLLPLLGATGLWRAASLLILAAGGAALVAMPRRPSRMAIVSTATLSLVALILVASEGPTAIWRHSGIGAGRASKDFRDLQHLNDWTMYWKRNTSFERDGVESSMAVSHASGYALLINGKSDGNTLGDKGTQIMGGLLGPLLHPAPHDVLIVGLGTGSSAGWAADAPDVVNVDVIELEPAVIEMARISAPVNQNVVENEKVDIKLGDAREYILTTDDHYDVIFSEPSNPYRAGVASLFTREFYEAAASRLAPGGLFVQWLQTYEITPESVASVYATVTSTFPNVQTWMSQAGDLLIVASREPLQIETSRIRGKLTQPGYKEGIRYGWGAHDVEGVLARLITDIPLHQLLELEGAQINTDDHNHIEFAFARSVGRSVRVSPRDLFQIARRVDRLGNDRIRGRFDPVLVDRRLLSAFAYHGSAPPEATHQAHEEIREALAAFIDGRYNAIPTPTSTIRHLDFTELMSIATGLAERGQEQTTPLLETLRLTRPVEAALIRARYLARTGRPRLAGEELGKAFLTMRAYPWAPSNLLVSSLRLAQDLSTELEDPGFNTMLIGALDEPFAVHASEEGRVTLLAYLTSRPWMPECNDAFMKVADRLKDAPLWNGHFLAVRAACFAQRGHPLAELAADQFETFASRQPRPIGREPEQEEDTSIELDQERLDESSQSYP